MSNLKIDNFKQGIQAHKHDFFKRNLFAIAVLISISLTMFGGKVGLIRAPLISNNDEVLINDAALTWAREGRLASKAFDKTLQMGKIYGHHPPVYLWIQSRVYSMFGFSPYTTRITSYLFGILTVLVFMLLLRSFLNQHMISQGAAALALLSLSCSFVFFRVMRMGRMETTAMFFGLLSVLLGTLPIQKKRIFIFLSSVFLSLAVGCHLQMLLYAPIVLLLWIIQMEGSLLVRIAQGATGAMFSVALLLSIWFMATYPFFPEAVGQFLAISKVMGKFGELKKQIIAQCLQHLGCTSIFLGGVIVATSAHILFKSRKSADKKTIAFLTAPLFVLIFLFSIIPFDYRRFLVARSLSKNSFLLK